ncbi:ras-related protein Rab-24-like [Leptopilina boulardi]|uniref:ras-related protein Rab-24-like n=1 Tax=Leptopilina boulardi TaxID=63433 RepID=UPI0021F64949|nr:ras-related protein Rab-24-like [Leptopilina boulardi]XP_051169647.1 ras-related protein Rab-24-like [Leptopilina boulardi]XP_051169648.1 ras-related protein Rab-24-like [Leptopilina boulardi]XP_051169649.1 ras-related protein Rab-24-like [Leptopilina boulardi]XP_051169650.1 ras-related protein Rab-24-like [Leptopilina boulardi]
MASVDFKVVLLGDRAVGKTCLIKRFVNDTFNEDVVSATIGVAFAAKQIQVDDRKVTMGLWDTSGCERFESMVRGYYRGAKAAIICYDISNLESFKRAKFWIREVREVEDKCKVYLCATKEDVLKNVSASPDLEIVERYAEGIQSKFFITSSKTGSNIAELFEEIAKDYIANPENAQKEEDKFITLTETPISQRFCYC